MIVDEVDSMLIDGTKHSMRLSFSVPQIETLQPILAAIFIHIKFCAGKIVEKDSKLYFNDSDLIDDLEST